MLFFLVVLWTIEDFPPLDRQELRVVFEKRFSTTLRIGVVANFLYFVLQVPWEKVLEHFIKQLIEFILPLHGLANCAEEVESKRCEKDEYEVLFQGCHFLCSAINNSLQ